MLYFDCITIMKLTLFKIALKLKFCCKAHIEAFIKSMTIISHKSSFTSWIIFEPVVCRFLFDNILTLMAKFNRYNITLSTWNFTKKICYNSFPWTGGGVGNFCPTSLWVFSFSWNQYTYMVIEKTVSWFSANLAI